jgi:hypothetical protein
MGIRNGCGGRPGTRCGPRPEPPREAGGAAGRPARDVASRAGTLSPVAASARRLPSIMIAVVPCCGGGRPPERSHGVTVKHTPAPLPGKEPMAPIPGCADASATPVARIPGRAVEQLHHLSTLHSHRPHRETACPLLHPTVLVTGCDIT